MKNKLRNAIFTLERNCVEIRFFFFFGEKIKLYAGRSFLSCQSRRKEKPRNQTKMLFLFFL